MHFCRQTRRFQTLQPHITEEKLGAKSSLKIWCPSVRAHRVVTRKTRCHNHENFGSNYFGILTHQTGFPKLTLLAFKDENCEIILHSGLRSSPF
jgi:hypothetical protein